jgi:hypothetical protein
MKRILSIFAVLLLTTVTTSVAAALPSDNFNDNSRNTSMWNLGEMDPCNVWLDETNQRLELRSTSVAEVWHAGAAYVANGWGFLPTDNFSFRVDFHNSFTSNSIGREWWVSVVLGLCKEGSDLAATSENNVEIQAGWASEWDVNGMAFDYSYAINSPDVTDNLIPRSSTDGTLYISYDAGADALYLSSTGYWDTNGFILTGLLKGTWEGVVVSPLLGGSRNGQLAVNSGDAYLDNFIVDSGTIIVMGDMNGDRNVSFDDLATFCEHWLDSGCIPPYGCGGADLNNDTNVDFKDFAILANNWLKSI